MKDAVLDEGILRKLNSYFSDLYFIFYKLSNFMNAQVQNKRQTVGSSCLKFNVDWCSHWTGRPQGSNGGERPRWRCTRERAEGSSPECLTRWSKDDAIAVVGGGIRWLGENGGARRAA
jgi:hypothetical protein